MKNKLSLLIILGIVSTYLILVIPQIHKLFVGDEVDFVRAAEGIVTTGKPIYTGANNKTYIGLWHPTLYVNILALSFRFFGVHEWSARIVSVAFTLLTLLVVYLITKHLNLSNFSKVLAIFIFLLNPLIVQGSILVDIDNSALMFFITLFVYAYLKLDKTMKNLFLLAILFAITLWAKISTPPVLILGILIYHALNREYRDALLESTLIGFIGCFLFLITWFSYCAFLDLPFPQPFIHNIRYLSHGDALHYILTHLWGFKNILFWATPFFLLLMLAISQSRIKFYCKNRKLIAVDFLVIVGLLIFFEYLIVGSYQTADFPRYFIPMMPFFSIASAYYFEKVRELERRDLHALVLVSVITVVYLLLWSSDPLLVDRVIFNEKSLHKIAEETAVVTAQYIIPFVISYIILKILRVRNAFILSIAVPLLLCSIYINAIQVRADYNTNYLYGERGMKNTIDYLSSRVNSSDIVIARKDVAYYLEVREFYRLPKTPKEFEELMNKKHIEYIVVNKEGYFTTLKYANVLRLIDSTCELDKEFGDFKIYYTGKCGRTV